VNDKPENQPSGPEPRNVHLFLVDFINDPVSLIKLGSELREIFHGNWHTQDPATIQERYEKALLAVAHFVRSAAIGADIAEQLAELALAFRGLRRGTNHAFFMPADATGRRCDRDDVWVVRAHVVCTYEFYRQAKVPEKVALGRIAEQSGLDCILEKKKKKKGQKDRADLYSSVPGWCERFKSGSIASKVAQAVYKRGMQHVAAVTEAPLHDIERLAERCLRNAQDEAAKLIFADQGTGK
jgi:hypothetical protein